MEKYNEKIFQKLQESQETLSKEDLDLWYKARHYVLDVMFPLDGFGIGPDSSKYVHIVLEDTNMDMIAIARQVALITHYINYDEESGNNKTVITFCKIQQNPKSLSNCDFIKGAHLDLFGNLLQFCKCTYIDDQNGKVISIPINEESDIPIDIEFEFTNRELKWYNDINEKLPIDKKKYNIIPSTTLETVAQEIDVTKGLLVNMVYWTGDEIDKLPATDNANVDRYTIALKMFCFKLKEENIEEKWKKNEKKCDNGLYNAVDIKYNLSSLFCADCFESRLKGILDVKEKSLAEYLLYDFDSVMKAIEKNIDALVKSEHARWNVEKLIMGFRPLNKKERYEDEILFNKEKSAYRKKLKKKAVHIDLASYRDLRRVDPRNMKYDYFLMLAMPQILLSTIK